MKKDKELTENSIPDDIGQEAPIAEDWEKRYKDTQSAYTKANQEKIELAKALVDADPNNIEIIKDEKVRNKILQEKWGVENLEELKILFPNYNKEEDEYDEEEDNKLHQLEKKIKVMEYQNKKTKTQEALKNGIVQYEQLLKTIPDFEEKINSELKYISSDLGEKERVEKAIKLVINSSQEKAGLYGALQGVKGVTETPNKKAERKIDKNAIKDILKFY